MTHLSSTLPPPTASRLANPFATCWTRPGALPYRFGNGQTAEQLVSKLATQHWRGTIVGLHGSGKSTLLEALKPALSAAGRRVVAISLHNGQRRLPNDFVQPAIDQSTLEGDASAKPLILVIDGFEQLAWLERFRIIRRCRAAGAGLLITSHVPLRIPTLIRLSPDRPLVERLVSDLCAKVSTDITPADIVASHACHGSNVREIFFDLYDRHEERRRLSNGSSAAS